MPIQLSVAQKELAWAMQLATRVLPGRTPLQSIAGVMLEARGDTLSVRATDLEVSLELRIGASIEQEGRTVLPGQHAAETVRSLPDGRLTLTEEEGRLVLAYGRGETALSTYDAAQFPVFPEMEGGEAFFLTTQEWQAVLRQVTVACGHDEVQPLFTGVLWEAIPGKPLTLVATDTHRLALWRKGEPRRETEEPVRAVIPRRALELAGRLAQAAGEGLAIEVGRRQVAVTGEAFTLVSRLIEGKYPAYEAVLPRELPTQVTVSVGPLLAALERAAILVREEDKPRANVVKLEIGPDKLTVSAQGAMGSLVEPLEAVTEGATGEIYFNVRYLAEALRALSAETARLRLNKDFSAALLSAQADETYLHLVLPVIVKSGA